MCQPTPLAILSLYPRPSTSHTHKNNPFPLPHLISWAWIQIGNGENSVKVPAIQYILSCAGNLAPGTLDRDDDKRNCSSLLKSPCSDCERTLQRFSPSLQLVAFTHSRNVGCFKVNFCVPHCTAGTASTVFTVALHRKRIWKCVWFYRGHIHLVKTHGSSEHFSARALRELPASCAWAATSRKANLPTGNTGKSFPCSQIRG